MKHVNKVKVIKEFPGFREGTILYLDTENGLFKEVNEESFGDLEGLLLENKPALSKQQVLNYLGTYFEDASEYEAKSEEEIKRRIQALKDYIKTYKEDGRYDEAVTVWQNMIWELEWVLGKRSI